MGSLVPCDDHEASVQGFALPSVFRPGAVPLGPFASSLEGSKAIIESYLAMMASGEIDANVPADVSTYHHFRLETLDRLWGDVSQGRQFFLKHPDDKGDHILVNDHYEIMGMIDWEWTVTVSGAEAFCSPCMMWPNGSPKTSLVGNQHSRHYSRFGRYIASAANSEAPKTKFGCMASAGVPLWCEQWRACFTTYAPCDLPSSQTKNLREPTATRSRS